MQRYIQEWHSPDFHQAIFWPFAGLLALGVAGFILSRRRLTWTGALLFGGTAAAGLLSSRHIPLFAIVSAPIICRYWLVNLEETRWYPFLTGRALGQTTTALAALNWLILLVMILVAGLWIANKTGGNEQAVAARYPVAAVDYLQEAGMGDRHGYNSYNWGGYLIWRGLPVFVDGRADVYGDEFLFYYRRTFDMTQQWQQPLEDYAVDYVLIEQGSPLANLLESSVDWRQAYADGVAAVYVPAGR
jgi:hypothetical protein